MDHGALFCSSSLHSQLMGDTGKLAGVTANPIDSCRAGREDNKTLKTIHYLRLYQKTQNTNNIATIRPHIKKTAQPSSVSPFPYTKTLQSISSPPSPPPHQQQQPTSPTPHHSAPQAPHPSPSPSASSPPQQPSSPPSYAYTSAAQTRPNTPNRRTNPKP